MITSSFITVIVCYGLFIHIQTIIPKAIALKHAADVNEYTIGEQRTRRRQNYVEQMALENELFDNTDDAGPPYDSKPFELDDKKEDLPALIVDYANLIRNDIILLDNSVETRTRKRGNVKVEKHSQAIPDVPCSCEYSKHTIDLGESRYPRFLENRTCSKEMCRPPYRCVPHIYELTILKKKISTMEHSVIEIPIDLKRRWIAEKKSITIGCMCTRDYIIDN
ncbi:hypothetical protein ACJJTC_008937 [Scirpophaga incertulas]